MSELIAELENISEILFNNGYNSWGNAIKKTISTLKEQQKRIETLESLRRIEQEGRRSEWTGRM